jgi:hypothetical protein
VVNATPNLFKPKLSRGSDQGRRQGRNVNKPGGSVVSAIQHSRFVTVVAWTAIILSGLGTLISILWVRTVLFSPAFDGSLQAQPQPFPPMVMHHFQLYFVLFALVSMSILVSAIALLKRRNWARLCFAALMLLATAWQLVSLGVELAALPSTRPQLDELEKMGGGDAGQALILSGVILVVFFLGMSALFGWIAKRLLSAPVAAEFRAQQGD